MNPKICEIPPSDLSVMLTKKAAFVGVFHQRKKNGIYLLVENTNKGEKRRNKKGRNADESEYADYTD